MASPALALFWFVIIVCAIPLTLWLLKRSRWGRIASASPGLLRSVSTLPLAPGQRVVVVSVGAGADSQWLVLGVTAQQITTLHTMAPQETGAGPVVNAPAPFAGILRRVQQGRAQ